VDRVRIGVVGAANIGRKVVIPAILRARNAELVALASSSDAGARFLRDTGLAAADGRPLRDAVRLHRGYAGCSPTRTSTRSTFRSRTTSTPSGRRGRPTRASTSCARSRRRSTRPRRPP
jgi:hypothetical protein